MSDEPVVFRQLLPEPATLTAAEVVGTVAPADRGDRPHVAVNMVSTADGRATLDGRAGPIGNRADRELFHWLRTRFDAVMAGAGTVRVEHYRRLIRDEAMRAQRKRDGLTEDPLGVIVSGRLDLPVEDVPLLADPQASVAVLTAAAGEIDGAAADIEYLRATGERLELATMLGDLRTRLGVGSVLCEGGPTLNGALLAEGLVDELFLSLAPKLTAGPAPLTIVVGEAVDEPVEMDLAWLLESEGHLFLRYLVR
jgi:riboflavin biosynthesis pyrimidine reductase